MGELILSLEDKVSVVGSNKVHRTAMSTKDQSLEWRRKSLQMMDCSRKEAARKLGVKIDGEIIWDSDVRNWIKKSRHGRP